MQKGPTPYRPQQPQRTGVPIRPGQGRAEPNGRGPSIHPTHYRQPPNNVHPGTVPPNNARPSTGQVPSKGQAPIRAKVPRQLPRIKFDSSQDFFGTDRKSAHRMRLLTIAFLLFYVLIVSSKLILDYRTGKNTAQSEHLTYTQAIAGNIAKELGNATSWIDNGLAEGQTAGQSALLIARSPVISATAILNAKGDIVGSYPRNSPILLGIPAQVIETETVMYNSIIKADGVVVPLIIKKAGEYVVVSALSTGTLINSSDQITDNSAIISQAGRIIDRSNSDGSVDLRKFFNLSEMNFSNTNLTGLTFTKIVKISGRKHVFAAVGIPNSNLYLLESKPHIGTSILQNNLMLFLILFIGTCALVVTLLNSLKTQLRVVQSVQQNTEISQQRYQAAIEGERGGVWEVDLTGSAAFVSASLAGLLGLMRKEQTMPLSKFLGLFHSDDRERFLAFARRAHLRGEFDFDIRLAHKPLVLQCRGRSSTRSGGELKRVIVGVALDITAQRAAQIRLNTAEARLHNALSSMTDSFVVWDAMNRLVVWNSRFEEFFNLTPGTLKAGIDHASVDYLANPSIKDRVSYQKGEERWVEYHLKNGRWIRYIETQISEGGHVSVGTDITELRLREIDLKDNEQALHNTVSVLRKSQNSIIELAERYESEKIRAEEASQSKSNFLASMSHELRTPLNAINGFSDIMKKEMFGPLGDPRYKEYVNDILFSGQHLLSLINDILDMSKIEAGKMTLNTEVMFLHEMVAQVVRMIRGRADDAELSLDVEVAVVREIEADPRSIKQVLLNLLTNAVKFTPEGGKVRVELIQKSSGIIVKVSDSGIGISKDNIEKLARPFEQVDDAANTQSEGTGLGLALSKSLVELHGGKFKIESVVGKGTTVIFSLPNKPVQHKDEIIREDVSQEVSKITADIADILGKTQNLTSSTNPNTAAPSNNSPDQYNEGAQFQNKDIGRPAA